MTIETDLNRIATAAERIVELLSQNSPEPRTVEVTPAPPAPATETATVTPITPAPEPTPAPAAPAPAAAPATLPFSDQAGLMQYVMGKYQALGAEKGAQIGTILQQMGKGAINDVQPAEFADFYAKVEAIQ